MWGNFSPYLGSVVGCRVDVLVRGILTASPSGASLSTMITPSLVADSAILERFGCSSSSSGSLAFQAVFEVCSVSSSLASFHLDPLVDLSNLSAHLLG